MIFHPCFFYFKSLASKTLRLKKLKMFFHNFSLLLKGLGIKKFTLQSLSKAGSGQNIFLSKTMQNHCLSHSFRFQQSSLSVIHSTFSGLGLPLSLPPPTLYDHGFQLQQCYMPLIEKKTVKHLSQRNEYHKTTETKSSASGYHVIHIFVVKFVAIKIIAQ